MRWNNSPEPVAGATRRKTRFLFFPLNIKGQSRWFEVCTFTEEYKVFAVKAIQYSTWVPVGWVDD